MDSDVFSAKGMRDLMRIPQSTRQTFVQRLGTDSHNRELSLGSPVARSFVGYDRFLDHAGAKLRKVEDAARRRDSQRSRARHRMRRKVKSPECISKRPAQELAVNSARRASRLPTHVPHDISALPNSPPFSLASSPRPLPASPSASGMVLSPVRSPRVVARQNAIRGSSASALNRAHTGLQASPNPPLAHGFGSIAMERQPAKSSLPPPPPPPMTPVSQLQAAREHFAMPARQQSPSTPSSPLRSSSRHSSAAFRHAAPLNSSALAGHEQQPSAADFAGIDTLVADYGAPLPGSPVRLRIGCTLSRRVIERGWGMGQGLGMRVGAEGVPNTKLQRANSLAANMVDIPLSSKVSALDHSAVATDAHADMDANVAVTSTTINTQGLVEDRQEKGTVSVALKTQDRPTSAASGVVGIEAIRAQRRASKEQRELRARFEVSKALGIAERLALARACVAQALQCWWRGYIGRELAGARRLQVLAWRERQNSAATTLQAPWRGALTRQRAERRMMLLHAVVALQCSARRQQAIAELARKRAVAAALLQRRDNAATTVQRWWRRAAARKARLKQLQQRVVAAKLAQRLWRGARGRLRAERRRQRLLRQKAARELAEARHRAVVLLQAAIRRLAARRRQEQLKTQLLRNRRWVDGSGVASVIEVELDPEVEAMDPSDSAMSSAQQSNTAGTSCQGERRRSLAMPRIEAEAARLVSGVLRPCYVKRRRATAAAVAATAAHAALKVAASASTVVAALAAAKAAFAADIAAAKAARTTLWKTWTMARCAMELEREPELPELLERLGLFFSDAASCGMFGVNAIKMGSDASVGSNTWVTALLLESAVKGYAARRIKEQVGKRIHGNSGGKIVRGRRDQRPAFFRDKLSTASWLALGRAHRAIWSGANLKMKEIFCLRRSAIAFSEACRSNEHDITRVALESGCAHFIAASFDQAYDILSKVEQPIARALAAMNESNDTEERAFHEEMIREATVESVTDFAEALLLRAVACVAQRNWHRGFKCAEALLRLKMVRDTVARMRLPRCLRPADIQMLAARCHERESAQQGGAQNNQVSATFYAAAFTAEEQRLKRARLKAGAQAFDEGVVLDQQSITMQRCDIELPQPLPEPTLARAPSPQEFDDKGVVGENPQREPPHPSLEWRRKPSTWQWFAERMASAGLPAAAVDAMLEEEALGMARTPARAVMLARQLYACGQEAEAVNNMRYVLLQRPGLCAEPTVAAHMALDAWCQPTRRFELALADPMGIGGYVEHVRAHMIHAHSAAGFIQRCFRSWSARMIVSRIRRFRLGISTTQQLGVRGRAASIIQRAVRNRNTGLLQAWFVIEAENFLRERAACCMQAMYADYKCRLVDAQRDKLKAKLLKEERKALRHEHDRDEWQAAWRREAPRAKAERELHSSVTRELDKLQVDQDKVDRRRRAQVWKYRKLALEQPAFGAPDPPQNIHAKRKSQQSAAELHEAQMQAEGVTMPVDEARLALQRDVAVAAARVATRDPLVSALRSKGEMLRVQSADDERKIFDLLRRIDTTVRRHDALIRQMRSIMRRKRPTPWQENWANMAWALLSKFRKAVAQVCPFAPHQSFAVHINTATRDMLALSWRRARTISLRPTLLRTHVDTVVRNAPVNLAFDISPATSIDRSSAQPRCTADCTVHWFRNGLPLDGRALGIAVNAKALHADDLVGCEFASCAVAAGAQRLQLTVDRFCPEHEGWYHAEVCNAFGALRTPDMCLGLQQPPSFFRAAKDVKVAAGHHAMFWPLVVGSPPIKFTWYFDGGEGRKQMKCTSNLLNIATTLPQNAGEYTLVASNCAGSATCSALLVLEEEEGY